MTDVVTLRMTNNSPPAKPRKSMGKRKKNPSLDWGEIGKDLAGASVGALVSTRVQSMVDDQLTKMDVEPQTRGVLKVLAAGLGIVGVSYLKQMPDMKDMPLEPFGYTAVGTTLKDGFDDLKKSYEPAAPPPAASGTRRKSRRRRRTQRGTFVSDNGGASMGGTLAYREAGAGPTGNYNGGMDPYDMNFMAMTNQYASLTGGAGGR